MSAAHVVCDAQVVGGAADVHGVAGERVDVDGRWGPGHTRRSAREALGVRGEGRVERGLALRGDELHAVVEDLARREEREAGVVMVVVVPREEVGEVAARLVLRVEAPRIIRLVLSVLNCDSLKALSFETRGREKLCEAPSSAKSCASVSLFIAEPRSECTVMPGSTPCRPIASTKSCRASDLHSLFATIQPTT